MQLEVKHTGSDGGVSVVRVTMHNVVVAMMAERVENIRVSTLELATVADDVLTGCRRRTWERDALPSPNTRRLV